MDHCSEKSERWLGGLAQPALACSGFNIFFSNPPFFFSQFLNLNFISFTYCTSVLSRLGIKMTPCIEYLTDRVNMFVEKQEGYNFWPTIYVCKYPCHF